MRSFFFKLDGVLTEQNLPVIAALCGAIITAYVICMQYGLINSDGILYVEVAKQLLAQNWGEAHRLYAWPFYPGLIAITHKVTGLPLQHSAYLLTGFFFSLSMAGIVMLVKELGGRRDTMLAAALLLLTFPHLVKSLLPMVIRDHGFFAAHIWSLVFFLRFCRDGGMRDAWLWGVCAVLAALFRVEGITYLIFLPLLFAWSPSPWRHRIRKFFKAHSLLLLLGGLIAFYLLATPDRTLSDMGRLTAPIDFARAAFFQVQHGLEQKAEIYGGQVLGKYLDDYALAGIIATLLLVLVYKAATAAGWFSLLVAAQGIRFGAHPVQGHPNFLFGLLVLGVMNAVFVLLSVFVLSSRYLLPVALVILLYGAFVISYLCEQWRRAALVRNRFAGGLVLVGLLLQGVYILLPLREGAFYELRASQWVAKNLPAGSRIYFDHGRLQYYSTGISRWREIKPHPQVLQDINSGNLKAFDYALLHVSLRDAGQQQRLRKLLGEPLVRFPNRRDEVVVYPVPRLPLMQP